MPVSVSLSVVTKQSFAIAYSGKDRPDDHSIDVEALAPALLAFGRLIREANAEFNGNRSQSKVLVSSDFEDRCFHIDFDVFVTCYEYLRTLLATESVKTAKEILEWIGLLKENELTVSMLGSLTFLRFLGLKGPRKIETATEIADSDGKSLVQIKITGDNNTVNVSPNVLNLSRNTKALKATRDVFAPIGQDGFDTVEVLDKRRVIDTFTPEQTQAIIAACNSGIEESAQKEPGVEITTAWLNIYSPVFDASATKWRFRFGRDREYMDISETNIAEDALARGGAMVNDSYQVKLEITTPVDREGNPGRPSYKILEVIKFIPGSSESQGSLFEGHKDH
jgi:hypothetical protein